jgi:5-methyltetrahydrofolate--homocysteine methyltransferase
VNSVFLYHCTQACLGLAIVNTEKIERFASIPDDERQMAEDLLYNRPPADPPERADGDLMRDAPADWRQQTPEQRAVINRFHIARLTEHFRGVRRERVAAAQLPLDERLASYIVDGARDGLTHDLQAKLNEGAAPLDIINGPLMAGMAEVGRLFAANQLIVAEVLQSAESMKAAVSFLEPLMEEGEASTRGIVLLATVKGDVHDIGKNLVEIILRNNGYEVVNLGIKVPPERLIEAFQEQRPDAVGLSGLLVKSAQQMVATAEDLLSAGIDVPILVGGAALSEGFTKRRIAPAYHGPVLYCSDAMHGLETMNRLTDGAERDRLFEEARPEAAHAKERVPTPVAEERRERSSRVSLDVNLLPPPDAERRVLARIPHLREIWSYVNPQMLYGKHLGLRGSFANKLAERDPTALDLSELVGRVQDEAEGWMRVVAVWRFYEATSDGNEMALYEPGSDRPLRTLRFPRQPKDDGLCLADYVLPPSGGRRDSVAVFVVGAGEGVRERAQIAKANGEYVKSHGMQALALETAEAAAEWMHRRMRELWGFADPADLTMKDRFAARYRGKRYSFGYPACPDLDGQADIFDLLRPSEIGIHLTDGMMMDPEASVSAIVFHHPDCTYFSATSVAR